MITVKVCVGSCCHLKGAYNVLQTFQQLVEEQNLHNQIEIQMEFCMKKCAESVCVALNDQYYSVQPETARKFFQDTILSRQ